MQPGPRNIKRGHSGCRPCRRRGKKCDEAKPDCRACVRLRLECSYGIVYSFRNIDTQSFQGNLDRTRALASWSPSIYSQAHTGINRDARYLNHFISHVSHLLPTNGSGSQFTQETLKVPYLRSAALCISASSLSMLNAQVQTRSLPSDPRRSVWSPLANHAHSVQAQIYHDEVLAQYGGTASLGIPSEAPGILIALTILAYYHHASTNHLQFRLAVWETVRFVSRHRESLTRSPSGAQALQMWYRLCVSHRLGKPPALLLDGEGISAHGPNLYPDSLEALYLGCIMGMSSDDLIYDILIKTIEIRSRIVVFKCVAGIAGVSEESRNIGGVAHGLLNRFIGPEDAPDKWNEAQEGFVRGSHLQGLLEVQRERLGVWKSRLRETQSPDSPAPFPRHRDAMNALYSVLCDMMFYEAESDKKPSKHTQNVLQILSTLNLSDSVTFDIYTFSLTEVLLQLSVLPKSTDLFNYILDDLWPRLESSGRGYEHSHYPTHLVKRIIGLIAGYWDRGRNVRFVLPAVREDTPKTKLLNVEGELGVVVCGRNLDGAHFVERVALP
ncbi:Zn(II)2Cys6 transcription factor domain-containing protein [Aspergillus mulundensis]|uniref:Zn(2)-C6 fungal-type domain-containing protein n=1 Tax=Aspergillus mulundensis TaxID=1810919 RepID=A0A3D8R4Q5_9EURO|nr:Uncharacterized protein DSM5745_08554 [Aspergillus mulundensis]RDW68794.1 Uncharacterized protein DSM5745_08554 [Aspergillus mulundensis]